MGISRRNLLAGLLMTPLSGVLTGCALFKKPAPVTTSAKKLPPIPLPPNAIQLDIAFIWRPIGDRLLGPPLWQHVDQLASLDAETRAMLRDNGFRAGVTASNPPMALQRMLGQMNDFAYAPEDEQAKQLAGQRCILSSGRQTEIQVSRVYPECELAISPAGKTRPRKLQQAVCKYRLTAERLQEGWVQLEFVPEVHHGDHILRQMADTEHGWHYRDTQQTEVYYRQRFAVRLGVGEMALLTAEDDSAGKLGELFFRGPPGLAPDGDESVDEAGQPPADVQRLLVVRLSGMQNNDAPHAV
ncbi:MAG: hypothetical protein ACT4QC_12295 [Planctomycetaceae bacterium]